MGVEGVHPGALPDPGWEADLRPGWDRGPAGVPGGRYHHSGHSQELQARSTHKGVEEDNYLLQFCWLNLVTKTVPEVTQLFLFDL